MLVFRHPDDFIERAIWSAIDLANVEVAAWTVVGTSVSSVQRPIARESPSGENSYEIQSYRLKHVNGSHITIKRETGLHDSVAVTPAPPQRPPTPAANSPQHRTHQNELAAYKAAHTAFNEMEKGLARLHSVLIASLGASPQSTDPLQLVVHAMERREAQFTRFELYIEDLTSKIKSRQLELEADWVASRDRLEAAAEIQLGERRAALERDVAALKENTELGLAERERGLLAREEKVGARESSADNTDNRTARRRLREQILAILTEREAEFSLTKATEAKRTPVNRTAVGAAVLSGAMLLTFSVVLPVIFPQTELSGQIGYVAAEAISAAGFGGAIIFLLKFNQHWAKRHADEEFYLKRMRLDFERASWLVEISLEYIKEKDEGIPPQMFERLSRGLFSTDSSPEVQHPFESILGAASSADIQMPNMNLQIKRTGRRHEEPSAPKD